MKILMVCLGNICRSPLAEGVLRDKINKAGLDWEVDSAGTSHYQSGCAPHIFSQKIAKVKGIDICDQQCRQFVKTDMDTFDKIYVMDEENYIDVKRIAGDKWNKNKVDLLLNEAYPAQNKSVPDPYYGLETDYHHVYDMIDIACEKIIAKAPALTEVLI